MKQNKKLGRPLKLTPNQINDIENRLIGGETVRSLAREYDVSAATISTTFSKRVKKIKDVTNRVVDVVDKFADLTVIEQAKVFSLADMMREGQMYMAKAAKDGALNAATLADIAKRALSKVDRDDPGAHAEAIEIGNLCGKAANDHILTMLKLTIAGVGQADGKGAQPTINVNLTCDTPSVAIESTDG